MALEITYRNDHSPVAHPAKQDTGFAHSFENLSEKQLWQLFKNGSEDAYAFIYHKYFHVLYNYGRQFSDSKEGVKDCIQDLFVEIWDRKENLGDTDSIKFYLFKLLPAWQSGYIHLFLRQYHRPSSRLTARRKPGFLR